MNKDDFNISVVIAALKEGGTTQKVVRDIKNPSSYKTQIIVVHGYFNDETEEIVKRRISILYLNQDGKSSEFFYLDKPKCKVVQLRERV